LNWLKEQETAAREEISTGSGIILLVYLQSAHSVGSCEARIFKRRAWWAARGRHEGLFDS
jgi:hypothetical protein